MLGAPSAGPASWSSPRSTVSAIGCGNLDDVTTVKDLRVLAIQAQPPGFLVDVSDPGTGADADSQATVTALVVDPTGLNQNGAGHTNALGCPDYLDAITAATGTATRVCSPTPVDVPDPTLQATLASTPLVPPSGQSVAATPDGGFTFLPTFQYGLSTNQLALLFAAPNTGNAQVDTVLANNRTFGLDAITASRFRGATRPSRQSSGSSTGRSWTRRSTPGKRRTRIRPSATWRSLAAGTPRPVSRRSRCPPVCGSRAVADTRGQAVRAPGRRHRRDVHVLREGPPERRHRGHLGGGTVALRFLRHRRHLLAGPAAEQALAHVTSPDRQVDLEPPYNPSDQNNLPADGNVTIWIVVHDKRAGAGWNLANHPRRPVRRHVRNPARMAGRHQLDGGSSTVSMTWMTPFDATTSAVVTVASLILTVEPETLMATVLLARWSRSSG